MNKESAGRLFSSDSGGCRPTGEQELLLRAALLTGKDALDAWQEWKAGVDIDRIDAGSQRLFPLLCRNLRNHGIEDPLMNTFRGVHRYIWYKNQIIFHNLASLLGSFRDEKIGTMLLKGAALILLYYKDYGLRYMGDFDLLVPTEQASTAIRMLLRLDWTPERRSAEALTDPFISSRHSHPFRNHSGQGCELHWHGLLEACWPGVDDDFREGAVSIKLGDVSTRVLNPTAQLLHISVHGAAWNVTPPLRWTADAMAILNAASSEIDWSRFIAQARRLCLILPARETMNYLHNVLKAPIPPGVLQDMEDLPVSRVEQIEYQAKIKPDDRSGPLLRFRLRYYEYLRSAGSAGRRCKCIGFPVFLQHVWGLDHLWQLPFCVIYRGIRRIIRLIVRPGYHSAQVTSETTP